MMNAFVLAALTVAASASDLNDVDTTISAGELVTAAGVAYHERGQLQELQRSTADGEAAAGAGEALTPLEAADMVVLEVEEDEPEAPNKQPDLGEDPMTHDRFDEKPVPRMGSEQDDGHRPATASGVPAEFDAYTCVPTAQAARSALLASKPNHPGASTLFDGAAEFAEQLAGFVRRTINATTDELPLRIAYFAHSAGDTVEDCLVARGGPRAAGDTKFVRGLGRPLCDMLNRQGGLAPKHIGTYMNNLLEMTPHLPERSWAESIAPQVLDFGYQAYKSFREATPAGCVYSGGAYPQNVTIDQLPKLKFFGMSGGGGAGTGFEILCVAGGKETTILSGGGGGGGGFTSPEAGTPMQAGGGGGGGAQIGDDGPSIGAGGGNHPPGKVEIKPEVNATAWAGNLSRAREQMRVCAADGGSQLVLSGGGGGGLGAETLSASATDPYATAAEDEPHALSVGWGFQFALGALIIPNAGANEQVSSANLMQVAELCSAQAFVSCPGNSIDTSDGSDACAGCVDTAGGGVGGHAVVDTSNIFRCADATAVELCMLAGYGKWQYYQECTCPVASMYKQQHLPDKPLWKFQRQGPDWCSRPLAPGQPAPTKPPLTERMIAEHPEWCHSLAGNPNLKGCSPLEIGTMLC